MAASLKALFGAMCLTLVVGHQAAHAAIESSYSFRQVNFSFNTGLDVVHEANAGPVPNRLSLPDGRTPNSTYSLEVDPIPTTFTGLSVRTSVDVNVDQLNSPEGWRSVEASTAAKTSLIDFGFVQGATGVPGGTLVFNWVVTGISDILLDTSNFSVVGVDDLFTWTVLESTIPGRGGVLINDLRHFPGSESNNQRYEQQFVTGSGSIAYEVPWTAGVDQEVFFDLTTRTEMHITNTDAQGFIAGLDADYSNTAELLGVDVLDQNGALLPNAQFILRSTEGGVAPTTAPVGTPEPTYTLLLVFGSIPFVLSARFRRDSAQL